MIFQVFNSCVMIYYLIYWFGDLYPQSLFLFFFRSFLYFCYRAQRILVDYWSWVLLYSSSWHFLVCVVLLLSNFQVGFIIRIFLQHHLIFLLSLYMSLFLGKKYSGRCCFGTAWIYCSISKDKRSQVPAEGALLCFGIVTKRKLICLSSEKYY